MSYKGRQLSSGNYLKLDDLQSQFNGSKKTFNLTSGGSSFYPGSAFSILVVLGGVIQEPEGAYTIDQSQITFAAAPGASDDFFCIALGVALGVGVPADGTVTPAKLTKPFNYNDGHLTLDTTNDRVGINSSTPGYTLDVRGDTRIVGILTVGTSSVTIDGTNNQVNVGTGVTIHHTNGVQVGGNTLHSQGLTVNSLNVSGVVSATSFVGDGSQLQGVSGGGVSTSEAIAFSIALS